MKIEQINLSDISEPTWQCKEYDEIRFRKLCAMIKKYGQLQTIVVMETPKNGSFTGVLTPYICLSGRNIVKALIHEKHLVCDCYNAGVLDVIDAQQISLMLNELEFQTDFVSVAELVRDVVKGTHVNNAVSHSMFDQREVKKFMKILEFDWEEFDRAKKEGKISLFESQIGVKEEADDETINGHSLDKLEPYEQVLAEHITEAIKESYGMANEECSFECEQPDTSNYQLPY